MAVLPVLGNFDQMWEIYNNFVCRHLWMGAAGEQQPVLCSTELWSRTCQTCQHLVWSRRLLERELECSPSENFTQVTSFWRSPKIATHIQCSGDLIVAEKPVLTMPRAVFDSDRQSTEDWLSKAINLLGSEDKELLLSLTDCCNPEDDNVTYIGLLYTNCMSWEGDVVVCPLVATANHSCRPNAQFVPRLDKGGNVINQSCRYRCENGHVFKHCQRHNGPRVLSLKLELSLQLKWVQSQFGPTDNSSFRLNTLGPLCIALGDIFWLFIQTLNYDRKPFNSIFNSKS